MTDKIAIIGFGNIANAIITPLLDKKFIQPENVYCVVKSGKSLENIKKNYKYRINVYESNSIDSKKIWDCQVKLLSVKPQHLKDIFENDNTDFTMILDDIAIELQASQSIAISEEMYILEMGDPNYFVDVSFEEFANEDGVVEIFEDNEETSDLFHIVDKEVQGQTTLFEDSDQDGQISDTERAFPVATADEEEVASGNVGVDFDDGAAEEYSEEPLEDIPTQNNQEGTAGNESYSYTTGCSDSRLTMALLPVICFIRIRRKTKETRIDC